MGANKEWGGRINTSEGNGTDTRVDIGNWESMSEDRKQDNT